MQKIIPNLWFDTQAEEAVNFYISIFENRPGISNGESKILNISYYGETISEQSSAKPGSVLTVDFKLEGQEFTALNGGPIFKFTEAVSFLVNCNNQEEIDYFWDKLLAGGEAQQCGWLKDRYGLSWQIVPEEITSLMADPIKGEKVMKAMFSMIKLDVNKLKEAAES
jgi:predicted 3-demethylubiquinone-9 3-methyltransferase (glyoxalase superfamily)